MRFLIGIMFNVPSLSAQVTTPLCWNNKSRYLSQHGEGFRQPKTKHTL